MTEPIATIPGRYDDGARRKAIDAAVGKRRHSTRFANLGVFTGYRIGFDIGNGNIGWCILFERGPVAHFLTAEAIADHNAALAVGLPKTQLPNLDLFVPLGTHKFSARDNDGKSLSKVRASARARRRTLDARQWRRWHLRELLVQKGLLPASEPEGKEELERDPGLKDNKGRLEKADVLRVRLLEPGVASHQYDLGRALYAALKRRGWMKPVGRAGVREDSTFGSGATAKYRQVLASFGCRTVGQFLDRCQTDARADGNAIRKRHKPLTWQKTHAKEQPKEGAAPKSYEVFPFLSPTFELMWEEAEALRVAQKSKVPIPDDVWADIKRKAQFRRLLKPTKPGRCQFLRNEWRCIRALPTFQEFRILQQVDNLRVGGSALNDKQFALAADILRGVDKISLKELAKRMGEPRLGRHEKDDARTLVGARTDIGLADTLGAAWQTIADIAERDRWVMRLLSRKTMALADREPEPWTADDESKLEVDCAKTFGMGALQKVRANANIFEDSFADLSVKAAKILSDGLRQRLDHDTRMNLLAKEEGAAVDAIRLFERLPYYGEVMPDLVVEADRFAPRERTAPEELEHGRAPNPDVHIVLNRLRKVTNAIVDMMGGILPTSCTVEVAREALSEDAAEKRDQQMRARERLRGSIVTDIQRALGEKPLPVGPRLDKLVDRWIAAIRQGWRDYDGNSIERSLLCEGTTYQLDHVSPAAFGEFQQGNLFVSQFNQQKGRQLPWQAFPAFRAALLAFAQFGLESQRDSLKAVLKRSGVRGRERLERRVAQLDERLASYDVLRPAARPDVLVRLQRTQTSEIERLLEPSGGDGEFKRGKVMAFRPGEQAALFKRLGPDATVPEGDFAARDVSNIGWSSKLAIRYLTHLGANVVSVKPWAVHALRCMFDINKDRQDLRNHAIDAFLIAHFDERVMRPAFQKLRGQHYEDLYNSEFLRVALDGVSASDGVFQALKDNLTSLDATLRYIATAHRPDHKWNPGDTTGGSYGSFGGENIYAFRPDKTERARLSALVWKASKSKSDELLSKAELLELMERDVSKHNDPDGSKVKRVLQENVKLRYRTRADGPGRITGAARDISQTIESTKNTFVNIEAKFAIAAPSADHGREIVGVADFSQRTDVERRAIFPRDRSVFRPGDTVSFLKEGCLAAWVVTALRGDGRVSLFHVDSTLRDKEERVTIPAKVGKQNPVRKIHNDVLGQRLHRRRKSAGDIQPVPYRLFGK
ncbi:MAG: hypothetical protein KIT25_15585 [Enhydrobacter sp.]|nr:MAG: hypothetical protein KIT25_15585 [Enhydrobacter sp.]